MDWNIIAQLRNELGERLAEGFDHFAKHTGHVVTGARIDISGPPASSQHPKPTHSIKLMSAPYAAVAELESDSTWALEVGDGFPEFDETVAIIFNYRKSSGKVEQRRVNGVVLDRTKDDNLIIRAFDLDRRAPRSFRVDRIEGGKIGWEISPR